MDGAVMTLARWHARQAIKKELLGQGMKLSHVEACEITKAANQYIVDHPEVIELASETYRSLVASGRLKPPKATKDVQHLGDLHGDGSPELQGLSLCKYRERNGGPNDYRIRPS